MQTGSPGPPCDQPGAPTLSDDLRVAASRGQLELVKELLASGASLEPDKDGRTALHYAAQEGHADTCLLLLGRGCGLDLQDMMGYSPLLRAASQGARDAVKVLLEAGCDVNVQDEHGNAAIHETCWNGFSQSAELLVQHGCDVFIINKAGFTALHLAAQNGHNESSRVLLYAGCNPDIKNNYGDTALHTAARYGHAGVARILISARCKLSEQNKNGDSALHIAAALKRRKIAKILVESGTDVELVNKQNETAMDVAKRKEHPEIMLIISTYAKPRPQHHHAHHHAVTFKDEIELVDGPMVCADDQPPLKQEPPNTRPEKEKKAGFFFSFKKKKKDKDKEKEKQKSQSAPTTPSTPGSKKLGSGAETPESGGKQMGEAGGQKSTVHGFFSRYVPRDGVQFYRDLAGNIKQGPIGYAPVCQCGPSLRHLESALTSTKESLHQRIDVSHHILSRRIDDIDMRTRPYHRADMGRRGGYATDTVLHHRSHRENYHTHGYHHHHPHYPHQMRRSLHEETDDDDLSDDEKGGVYDYENSLAMGIGSRESRDMGGTARMQEDLEHWLTDKLASYGHCLNHHHDDSALPPRNLFADFPHSALGMGRLVRSRSDETLSASDYSGKFRKKDFYASRQAAMQQIRGWELPKGGTNKSGRRDKSSSKNNTASNEKPQHPVAPIIKNKENVNVPFGNKVVTQAQVHCQPESERFRSYPQGTPTSGGGQGLLSPSTNSTTSPGTLASNSMIMRSQEDDGAHNSSVRNSASGQSWHKHQQQQQHGQQINASTRDSPSKGRRNSINAELLKPGDHSDSKEAHLQQDFPSSHYVSKPSYPPLQQYVPHHKQPQDHDARFGQSNPNLQAAHMSWQKHGSQPQQNLSKGSPSNRGQSPGKQEDFSSPKLAGQSRSNLDFSSAPNQLELSAQSSSVRNLDKPQPGLTRYQDNYGVRYNRTRTLSSDLLNENNYEEVNALSQPQGMMRSRSVDNSLEDTNRKGQLPTSHSSGYSTDTAAHPDPNAALVSRRVLSPRSSGRETQSLSPAPRATTRYRLPETSTTEATSFQSQRQQGQRVSSPHSNATPPSVLSHRSPRSSEATKHANISASSNKIVTNSSNAKSPQIFSKPMLNSDQIPFYESSRSFSDRKDSHIYSRQHVSQFPPKHLEATVPDSAPGLTPMRECLQHDNTLLSPHFPSSSVSKEDSTCSSNQDSGYGKGKDSTGQQSGGGGADTSIGTPSSSFSIERSNTPSTAGSPYASQRGGTAPLQPLHHRMSYLPGRGRTCSPLSTGPDGSFRSSSSESHRQEDLVGPNTRSSLSGPSLNGYNSHRRFSSPLNHLSTSTDSAVCRSSQNSPHQRNYASDHDGQPYSQSSINTYSKGNNVYNNLQTSQQSSHGDYSVYSNPQKVLENLTNTSYSSGISSQQGSNMSPSNQSFAYSTAAQPKNPNSRVGPIPPPKPKFNKTPNHFQSNSARNSSIPNNYGPSNLQQPLDFSVSGSAPLTNSNSSRVGSNNQPKHETHSSAQPGHISQSAVQAHVQGWYQKKLLEAAQRLRQSESYGNHPPSPPFHTKEAQFMDSTSSGSPRPVSNSTSSTGNDGSRGNHSYSISGYSSSSPSPSPLAPRYSNHDMARSHQPSSGIAYQQQYQQQSEYHHQQQQQQQQFSYGARLYNSNNSTNNFNTCRDSSPFNRASSSYQPPPSTFNHSIPNNTRSFPPSSSPSQSHVERGSFYSESHRPTVSNLGGESSGYSYSSDLPRKTLAPPYHSPSQINYVSDLDSHNNNNQYYSSDYGLTRADSRPLRYDPIHGSDV
ncbi:ankyrin repeat domain-containing protein 6 [Plakobranchus ocellatus]|uniref:Ankyrin repeat domain-containing protein 6 n=1 Tax=Plakobranchus ocellatus TaxID=259542 RepID=A0AAV4A488_9GAST|nr:ankyrin repeat domain-containing protein 6 [Plakobranchus ocellatus]